MDLSPYSTDQITQQLRAMHITGYYFAPMVDTNSNELELSEKILNKVTLAKKLRSKIDLDFVYFSDDNARRCFEIYRSHFADSDPGFAEMSKMKIKTKVFDSRDAVTKKQKKWNEVMANFGYQTQGASILRLKQTKPFIGVFIFLSDKGSQVLESAIDNPRFPQLVDQLFGHFIHSFNDSTNPWRALGGISGKSHTILQLLSEGLDTSEIADAISMSKRGVDYHVETMKQLFQAKNRIHLVVKALKAGVIS